MDRPKPAPRVSVVLPAYQSARWIGEAVGSILAQDFTDFELIVVDDGSTDGTAELVDGIDDPRLVVIRRAHAGLVASLNAGVERASGEYVARMDADDLSRPERLGRQVAYLDAHPECVAVGSDALLVDPERRPIRRLHPALTHEEIDAGLLRGNGSALLHASALMRRQVVLAIGGYRSECAAAEDLDLFLRLAEHGRLANLSEVLYEYRQAADEHVRPSAEAILREALRRRGLPDSRRVRRAARPPQDALERRRVWAWHAIEGGYLATARHHAWAGFRAAPFSLRSIQLLARAAVGLRVAWLKRRWRAHRVLASILALAMASSASAETGRPPNVIVFLVDMLRPDHLGAYGYAKNTSPELDRLAAAGVVFEDATAPAPWTLPSTVSLLTGLMPPEHGAGDRRVDAETRAITYPADPAVWLPKRFAEQGYTTVAFHSHPYLLRSVSSIHEAFDEYYYPPADKGDPASFRVDTPYSSRHIYLDTVYPPIEAWLERHARKPFFLYLHVIDVRGPYAELHLLDEDRPVVERGLAAGALDFPKVGDRDLYQASDRAVRGKSFLYDGHIRFVDEYLGRLQRKLEALGIADDTYLVFTSDHGEGFGEQHDYWGHGRYVYEPHIRVPLALLSHRSVRAAPRRIAGHVNTVGLLATLAALAGIELEPRHASRGFQRLLAPGEPPGWKYLSVSSGSYGDRFDAIRLGGRFKLIQDRQTGAAEFFDLREDPGERRPLDPRRQTPVIRKHLEELAADGAALRTGETPAAIESRALGEDEERALEALGYVR